MREKVLFLLQNSIASRHNITADLKAVESILGHADISTTMNIYAEATTSGVHDSMKALEDLLAGNER